LHTAYTSLFGNTRNFWLPLVIVAQWWAQQFHLNFVFHLFISYYFKFMSIVLLDVIMMTFGQMDSCMSVYKWIQPEYLHSCIQKGSILLSQSK
jgi:hypothetical protein